MSRLPSVDEANELYADNVEHFPQADPILLYYATLPGGPVMAPVQLTGVGPDTPLPVVLMAAIDEMVSRFGPPDWLVLSYEAFGQPMTVEEFEADPPEQGTVTARGYAGDPRVQDVVAIIAVAKDTAWQSIRPFVRGESGAVVWGETTVMPEPDIGGPTFDVLVTAVRP